MKDKKPIWQVVLEHMDKNGGYVNFTPERLVQDLGLSLPSASSYFCLLKGACCKINSNQREKINNHIGVPDWEKKLLPLFLFKGTDPYRIRTLSNVAHMMFVMESDDFLEGRRLALPNGNHGELCGSESPLTTQQVKSIFTRLRGCRDYTDSIGKDFTEYVEHMHPSECGYVRVPLCSNSYRHASWRKMKITKPKIRKWKAPPEKIADKCYPYIEVTTDEQKMVTQIYSMIPKSVPFLVRSDLCQDLIVAVLSGETTIDEIPNVIKKYASKARDFMPSRWKTVSMNMLDEDKGDYAYKRFDIAYDNQCNPAMAMEADMLEDHILDDTYDFEKNKQESRPIIQTMEGVFK